MGKKIIVHYILKYKNENVLPPGKSFSLKNIKGAIKYIKKMDDITKTDPHISRLPWLIRIGEND